MELGEFSNNSKNNEFLDLKSKNISKKSDKIANYKILIRAIGFIAFLFFCSNIALMGFIFYNAKNSPNKKLNVNYYNVNLVGDGISTYAVQNAWQSSVCIAAGGSATDEYSFFNNTASRGSGIIYDIDSDNNQIYIMSCYHVISGFDDNIFILFSTSLVPQKATIVGYSSVYDIVILKTTFSQKLQNCSEITLKNSQLLSIGENVFAVGNSLSGGLSATCGIISRLNKEVIVEGNIFREIQTDASINPGNSGGGLFNNEGLFVGLINAKFSSINTANITSYVEGTSFAIPGTLAVSIAKSIINNNGFPTKIKLGIEFENYNNISISNIDENLVTDYEVRVSNVQSNSLFGNTLRVDDVILSFDYFDLNGDMQEVYMSNKYCYEDISFDVRLNSDITFNIIRPLTGEKLSITVMANYQYVQT